MIAPHISLAVGTPIITASTYSNIFMNSATLSGSVNPNGSLTAVKFIYGSDQSNLDQTAQLSNLSAGTYVSPVTATISGLVANTPYYFQIFASNASGLSFGPILSFTTQSSGPSTLPGDCSPVCTLPASEITETSAKLWGYGYADPSLPTTAYFRVSAVPIPPVFCNDLYGTRKVSTDDISLPVASSFSWILTGLTPDTKYYYCAILSTKKVIAYGNNAVVSFSTKPCSTCAQSSIQTKPASAVTKTSATLNGYYNTNVAATTWFEYGKTYNTVIGGGGTVIGQVSQYAGSFGNISFPATNLSQNTDYYYRAVIKQGGNTTYGISATHFKTKSTGDTNPCGPDAPSNPWIVPSQNATLKTIPGSASSSFGGLFGPSILSGGGSSPTINSGSYDANGDPCNPPPKPGFFPSTPSFPTGVGPSGPVPAVAPDDAIVRFKEGVEHVLARQIIKNPAIAQLFGYQSGADLNQYAYYLAHLLAQFFGYVKNGQEILVSLPDVAAYELKLTNGVLMINEYFAGFLISSRQVSPFKAPPAGYEYKFRKF